MHNPNAQQIEKAAEQMWIARRARLANLGIVSNRDYGPWSAQEEAVKEAVRLEAAAALRSYIGVRA